MTEIWKAADAWELLQAHQFALINRAKLAPQEWHEQLPLLPLVKKELRATPERSPALLPLAPDAPYMDALAQNLELALKKPKLRTPCALFDLFEDTKPERLQRHLADCLVPRLASGGKAYLRYFDPTVFPKLARIIPPNRWSLLYGPIRRWTIPFQNEWISFPVPEVEHKAAAWVITDPQWERIERIRFINNALMQRELTLNRPWESFEEYDQAGKVAERAMLAAQKLYGIEDKGDLMAYVVDAVTHGEHFHRHPTIQDLLRTPSPEGYGAASGELDETIWAEAQALARNTY